MRIAALITAHNRREVTLKCLERLKLQRLPRGDSLTVIVVDDGSTDGTAAAIASRFPKVKVLRGDGNLYWNGGMRRAMVHALEQDFSGFLLLNDDTFMAPNAIERLAAAIRPYPDLRAIAVGTITDPVSGQTNYGGWSCVDLAIPARVVRTPEGETACDTFNGNCVLVGGGAARILGNLDAKFTHGMGDMDYGFRAKTAGIPMILLPDIGICEANDGKGLWVDKALPTKERWKRLIGPKGLPPKEWFVYCKRHGGNLWAALWMKPYAGFWLDVFRSLFSRKDNL